MNFIDSLKAIAPGHMPGVLAGPFAPLGSSICICCSWN